MSSPKIPDQSGTEKLPEPATLIEAGSSQPDPFDSPLAGQLPQWDLLPPHTILVRRRPIRAS